jgi:uncharacterized protein (TIRG00374 family)
MSKNIKNVLKFLIFVGVGVVLFWLVYKDQDFSELFDKIADIRWWWFVPAIIIMMASHVSRALRWNLLLSSVGDYKPRFINTFFAVMTMYFVNMALPRVGEVTRSGIVSRYDKVPFLKVLGTMVTERAMDVLLLLILTVVVIFSQGHVVSEFISNNPDVKDSLGFLLTPMFWILFALVSVFGLIFIILLAKRKFDRWKVFAKLGEFVRSFLVGIKSVFKLKNPWAFIGHSLFIYLMYFGMLWICFYAFPGLEHLNGMAALTIFVAGSYGMVAPAPNGMGAWHFMTIQTMVIFGVLEGDARLFALVVHGIQMVMLIIFGVISLIGLPIVNRNRV